jgi:hypothetical protein
MQMIIPRVPLRIRKLKLRLMIRLERRRRHGRNRRHRRHRMHRNTRGRRLGRNRPVREMERRIRHPSGMMRSWKMGIVRWRGGSRGSVRGTTRSRLATSFKQPTPGDDALACGRVEQHVDETGATKDTCPGINTCQSPIFAGELTEAGDGKGHRETNVGDGIRKESEGDLVHSFVCAFGFGDHVVASFDGGGSFFGGDGDGLGLDDCFGVGGGLVGGADFEVGLPAREFVGAAGHGVAAREAFAEVFELSADVEEEDAVEDRQRKHVDEQKDCELVLSFRGHTVMKEDSLVVVIGSDPAPSSTCLIV